MSGHTKGPWTVGTDSVVYDERHRDPICDAAFRSDEVSLANANLIAAAPDLLEALDYALSALAHCRADKGYGFMQSRAANLAANAIAKARGEA